MVDKDLDLSLFKNCLDVAPICVIITETTNREGDNPIVYVNKKFTELTGYNRDEIIGRDCRFLQGARYLKTKNR